METKIQKIKQSKYHPLKKYIENYIYMVTMDDEKKPTKEELKILKKEAISNYQHNLEQQGDVKTWY